MLGVPPSAHLAGQLPELHPDLALHSAKEQAFDPAGAKHFLTPVHFRQHTAGASLVKRRRQHNNLRPLQPSQCTIACRQ